MASYGKVIARLRKEKGMTQSELAEKLYLSPQAVSKWENDLSEPDLKTLEKLSEIFDKPVDVFFGKESSSTLKDKEVVETDLSVNGFKCTVCEETMDERFIFQKYPKIVCEICHNKKVKEIKLEFNRKKIKKTYIKYGVIAVIVTILIMVIGIVGGAKVLEAILGSLLIGVVTFSLLVDFEHVGPAYSVFEFFNRGISLPGVIFSLSIDGIIFLIVVKVIFGLITIILSALLFIVGISVSGLVSLFSFIPIMISNFKHA